MFLDLKSSTALAEELGPEPYLHLINEFFRDISGPVLDRGGEIYEYVGDEAVITWEEARGINGDVLNTGARIQAECARLGKRLISSAELTERMTVPDWCTVEDLGSIALRGKAEPIELVAFA